MTRIALSVCLSLALLLAALPAAGAPAEDAAAARDRAARQERLALALLGQIASGDEARATRARRMFAALPTSVRLRPLAQALGCEPAALRSYAARQLGASGAAVAARPLLFRVVRETRADVRAEMVKALRVLGDEQSVHVLGRALGSRVPAWREHAAEALALLGDELAYPYLLRKWEGRSGDFPRVYISQARQVSYIQDFDVEVAATSFIADPIVGVLQDSTVLGVKVLGTEQIEILGETRALRSALETLSGETLGAKVGAWRSWWEERKDGLLAARAARYAPEPHGD